MRPRIVKSGNQCPSGSFPEDTVKPRTPTLVSCNGPGVSSGVGQVLTLISGRPGVPADEGAVLAPISGRVGTLGDKENVLPRVHKSLSQFENADGEYLYDEYAVCGDMLHDRNVNMFHRDAPRYHVPRVQGCRGCDLRDVTVFVIIINYNVPRWRSKRD